MSAAASFGSQYAVLESQYSPNGNNQNYQAITTCVSGMTVGSTYRITCSIASAAASTAGTVYSPNDFFVTFNGTQIFYTSAVTNSAFYAITTAPFVATSSSGILSLGVTNPNFYPDAITLVDNVVLAMTTPLSANSAATAAVANNADAFAANVVLLLHFDANSSAAMFTDMSPVNNVMTATGAPTIVTTPAAKIGAASVYFGAGNFLSTAASPIFTLGVVDFTIESWVYFSSAQAQATGGYGSFCGNVAPGTTFSYGNWSFGFTCTAGTGAAPYYIAFASFNAINGVSATTNCPTPAMIGVTNITTNAWHHVALCRYGYTFYMYLDGNLEGTLAATAAGLFGMSIDSPLGVGGNILAQTVQQQSPQYLSIGSDGSATATSNANYFAGYIDEFRVTKGIARYVPCQFYALDSLSPAAMLAATGFYDVKRVLAAYTGATLNLRGNTDATGANKSDFYADQSGNLGTTLNAGATSLVAWMQANGYTSVYVTVWYDQSGKANHATQTTIALQPTYDVSFKRVVFNGAAYLSIPSGVVAVSGAYFISAKHGDITATGTTPCTIVGVGNATATNYLRTTSNTTTEAAGLYCNAWNNTTPSATVFGTGATASYAAGTSGIISGGTNYWQNPTIVSVKYDNAYTSTGYVNGKSQGIFSVATGLSVTPQAGTIGVSQAGGTLNNYLNGQLYALSLFMTALTDTDRVIVEQVFALDNLSSAAAMSANTILAPVRALSSYTGPAFRIRGELDPACVNFCDFFADIAGNLGTALNAGGVSLGEWMLTNGYSVPYIMTWYDQSGQGANATQTVPSLQPTYDILNKQVKFNGTSQYFMLPNWTIPTGDASFTFAVRHGVILQPTGNQTFLYTGTVGGGAGTQNAFLININSNLTSNYYSWWQTYDYITTGSTYFYGNGAAASVRYLGGSNGVRVININGQIPTYGTATGGTRNSPAGPVSLGATAQTNGSIVWYLAGNLVTVCVFNTYLSDSDRAIAENIIPPISLATDFPRSDGTSGTGSLTPGYPQVVVTSGYYTYGMTSTNVAAGFWTARANSPAMYVRLSQSLNWTAQADFQISSAGNVITGFAVYLDTDNGIIPFSVEWRYWSGTSNTTSFEISGAGATTGNPYSVTAGSANSTPTITVTPGSGWLTLQLTKNGNYYYGQYSTNNGAAWTGFSQWASFITQPTTIRLAFVMKTGDTTVYTSYMRNLAITYNNTQLTQVASGGTMFIQNINGIPYVFHVFSNVGAGQSFVLNYPRSVDVLVVAGGGGGGVGDRESWGGGAGGFQYFANTSLAAKTYAVTVGAGGAGGTYATNATTGVNGGNSVFGGLAASVGGGGGSSDTFGGSVTATVGTGGNGGSSGGGKVAGTPTAGQGYTGSSVVAAGSTYQNGSGGGGAGGPGIAATAAAAGAGGPGALCSITGTPTYYAGGGGGGAEYYGTDAGVLSGGYNGGGGGFGGIGGGGYGGYYKPGTAGGLSVIPVPVNACNGGAGMPNTGGGGGGGGSYAASAAYNQYCYGGAGGSGIVIVRYPLQLSAPWGNIPNNRFDVTVPPLPANTGSDTYPVYVPGWTLSGNANIISGVLNWTAIFKPYSTFVLGLQSSSSNPSATTTITGLVPGNSYKITTWVMNRDLPPYTNIQTLTITVAGNVVYKQAMRSIAAYYLISTNIFTISSGTTASLVLSGAITATDQTCFVNGLQLINVTGQTQPAYTTNFLLAYWDFGLMTSYPGAGYYVYDLSGNNLNLTWNTIPSYNSTGAISVTVTVSQSAYVAAIFDPTIGFTYECLVYVTTATNSLMYFCAGTATATGVIMQDGGTGAVDVYFNNGTNATQFTQSGTAGLNAWVHITFTNTSANAYAFYINGVLNSTGTSTYVLGLTTNFYLGIGSWQFGTANGFAGNYGMARVYAGALTAAQVRQNYMAVYNNLPGNPYNLPVITSSAIGGNVLTTTYVTVNGVSTKYYVHSFTTVGTATFTLNTAKVCDILVIGGGGGGGTWASAGGGAGGYQYFTAQNLAAGSYTITVGAGGASSSGTGNSGNNSQFGSLAISYGGGGGGHTTAGLSGGSGGGGANGYPNLAGYAGGAGTAGQGNAGGSGGGSGHGSAGGGGAGAPGGNGTSTVAGNGGNGLQNSITGTPTYYAGGGGATFEDSTTLSTSGGLGGGGAGSSSTGPSGGSGTPNTGGGGGGGGGAASTVGGAGGSGIVIVRYPA